LNPAIDTIITAETPEGIEIAIRPAGFAVRCTAFLIDAAIRFGVLIGCAGALGAGRRFGTGVFFIALFVINWLYPVIFELTAAAATPGKRMMGLYVLMVNGLPITPAACLTRNLLRVIDFLPMMYGFGIVSILLRRDARRLGDLAAGTVVAYKSAIPKGGMFAAADPMPPSVPLSARQQAAITAFAWRVSRLTAQRAEEIAAFAAAALGGGAAPPADSSITGITARLVGIARWLHGERVAAARPARPPI
jgi:uncharacterized RDD family membrane protein YckC